MRMVQAGMTTAAFVAALALPTSGGQAPDAADVLGAARDALGGNQALAAVKTFIATGRTRQIRGNNMVAIEFEIACELPNRFVRKDEIPAQDTDVTVTGFDGDELIQSLPIGRGGSRSIPGAAPPGRGGPRPNLAPQRVATIKQDFARLMLGVFATSFPIYPLTFKYAAEGEAPEGKADILDVVGQPPFTARFVIQRSNHLPVMLMWQTPPPPGNDRAQPTENRLYFADYRAAGAIKWPFRIRRAVAGTTVEETTFDRVTINARIDPKKFEAPK